MKRIIKAGQIYTPDLLKENYLIINNKKVIDITDDIEEYDLSECQMIDYAEYSVIPGLIDIHIHGGAGVGVMEGKAANIETLAKYVLANGITSFLPTTLTAAKPQLMKVLEVIQKAKSNKYCASIAGVHLEGPFISLDQAGAQNKENICLPDRGYIEDLLSHSNLIKVISLAPEIEQGLETVEYLTDRGIVVSVAHSDATFEEMQAAFARGLNQATHFFNKMGNFHHREPGVIGAVLQNKDCFCELIADGIHVHPKVINLLINCKGIDNIILVSDSIAAAGMSAGEYELGEYRVTVDESGKAYLTDGTLAGSTLQLRQALKNVMKFTSLDLAQVLKMATINPAKQLGLQEKGRLEVGQDADFVVIDEELEVIATYKEGEKLYEI